MFQNSIDELDDLLHRICNNLQITKTQYSTAESRYVAVGEYLSREDGIFAVAGPSIYPQGSFRIGTMVKPLTGQEYDLDIVCELNLSWPRVNPEDVLKALARDLRANHLYAPILEQKNRCIRLNYAGEFHMDILPACPNGTYEKDGNVKVPDRATKEWKDSNPKGYAEWFNGRSELVRLFAAKADMQPLPPPEPAERKPSLKRAVQLMKRHRDVAFKDDGDTAPISIVLSTLAGWHYQGEISVAEALARILERITASIPRNGQRLIVVNPTNPDEDLSERWGDDPIAYGAFVGWVHQFMGLWSSVENTTDKVKLAKILSAMFGEDITNQSFREQAKFVENVRQEKLLGISPGRGTLLTGAGIAVPRNTFYGH